MKQKSMDSPSGLHALVPLASLRANEKAQAVLSAATAVFLAQGFSAATTDMIQREAGVSKSTVYVHYTSKEALFAAVIEAECDKFAQNLRDIRFRPSNLRNTLTALGRAYLDIVLSPSGLALYRIVMAEAPRFPQLARRFYLAGPQLIGTMLAARLDDAVQAKEMDAPSVGLEAAANLYASLLRGEAQMQCLTHPDAIPSAAQVDQWVALAVRTFLRAFGRTADFPSSSSK